MFHDQRRMIHDISDERQVHSDQNAVWEFLGLQAHQRKRSAELSVLRGSPLDCELPECAGLSQETPADVVAKLAGDAKN